MPEASEIAPREIKQAIEATLVEAEKAGVSGKAVTPFLLDAILKQTGGRSLTANIALIRTVPRLVELNIGHSIIARAIFTGLDAAVRGMLAAMNV